MIITLIFFLYAETTWINESVKSQLPNTGLGNHGPEIQTATELYNNIKFLLFTEKDE